MSSRTNIAGLVHCEGAAQVDTAVRPFPARLIATVAASALVSWSQTGKLMTRQAAAFSD